MVYTALQIAMILLSAVLIVIVSVQEDADRSIGSLTGETGGGAWKNAKKRTGKSRILKVTAVLIGAFLIFSVALNLNIF